MSTFLVKGNDPKAVSLIAASIFANRKLWDDDCNAVDDIKSWDEVDAINEHVDEYGIKHTMMSSEVNIIVQKAVDKDLLLCDLISRIFGKIGLPVKCLFESDDFVTSVMTIPDITRDGCFDVGTGKHMKNIKLVGMKHPSPFIINVRKLNSEVYNEYVNYNNMTNAAAFLLSSIIIDTEDMYKGQTYDQIDIGDCTIYNGYDNIIQPKYPYKESHFNMDIRYNNVDIYDKANYNGGYLVIRKDILYINWASLKPVPVHPTNYDSINALLSRSQNIDEYITEIMEMSPINRTDICIKCKTPLYSDIYILESQHKYHICVCSLCMHLSNISLMISEANPYTLIRTKYPRAVSEFIDQLDNPPIYNKYIKLKYMGMDVESIEKKLNVIVHRMYLNANHANEMMRIAMFPNVDGKPVVLEYIKMY